MAFVNMTRWTKNSKAYLENNNNPREIGLVGHQYYPQDPFIESSKSSKHPSSPPQHMSRQRRLWAQQGSPAKWDKWEGARGGALPSGKMRPPAIYVLQQFPQIKHRYKWKYMVGKLLDKLKNF